MKFLLNIAITDDEYIDFNTFTNTSIGEIKKSSKAARIIGFVAGALIAFSVYLSYAATKEIPVFSVILLCFILLMTAFSKIISVFLTKSMAKRLNKGAKKLYTPFLTLEFYDDYFVENATGQKIETKYFMVDKIAHIKDKYIFIYINDLQGIIIPVKCFESKEQYQDFLEFIKNKYFIFEEYDKI